MAQELDAVVRADNVVVTLLLDTGVGTYVRFDGDWQVLSPDSTALDDYAIHEVSPGALDVWDRADTTNTPVSIFELPRPVTRGRDDTTYIQEPATSGGAEEFTGIETVTASGTVIPMIQSVDDLDRAIQFGNAHPEARWYTARRARAFGAGDRIPEDWSRTPFPGVRFPDGELGTQAAVVSAAKAMSAMCASGQLPPYDEYAAVISAARHFDLLEHEAIIAAVNWRSWLHPRGRDGRFIVANSFIRVLGDQKWEPSGGVDAKGNSVGKWVPANVGEEGALRARVVDLRPEGIVVSYLDPEGNPVAPNKDAGFPALLPPSMFGRNGKIEQAQVPVARLKGNDSFAALSDAEYARKIADFNENVLPTLRPERSLLGKGITDPTEDQLNDHREFALEAVGTALREGISADEVMQDEYGVWTNESVERMASLMDELLAAATVDMPKDRKALFLGGLPGSGKTYTVSDQFPKDQWIWIDPDSIKEKIIEKGWFPQIDGMTPMDSVGLFHQQSSMVAANMRQYLISEGYNVVVDGTMGGKHDPSQVTSEDLTIEFMRNNGYEVGGVFVNANIEDSRASVVGRWTRGMEKYLQDDTGTERGGRLVPDAIVTENLLKPDDFGYGMYESANQQNFMNLAKEKNLFDGWKVYQSRAHERKDAILLHEEGALPVPPGQATVDTGVST